MLDSERFAEVAGTILAEDLGAEDTMTDAAAETIVDAPRVTVPPPPPFAGRLRARWARLVPLLRVGR